MTRRQAGLDAFATDGGTASDESSDQPADAADSEAETHTHQPADDDRADSECEPQCPDRPANESVRLITGITGVLHSPEIIDGETSSTGKTITTTEPHTDSQLRLDTDAILGGESEYRDSRYYELYTPKRFRNAQRSNQQPGPRAGTNGVTDAADLPEPTHCPPDEDPYPTDEAEEPADSTAEAGDTDDTGADEWPDALDMQTWSRGGVIETSDRSLLLTRLSRAAGFDTVLRAEAVDRDGTEYQLRAPRDHLHVERAEDPSAVVVVDDVRTYDADETNYAGVDAERLRRWLRNRYDDRGGDGDGGLSRDDDDPDGGTGDESGGTSTDGTATEGETPTIMTDGGRADLLEWTHPADAPEDALDARQLVALKRGVRAAIADAGRSLGVPGACSASRWHHAGIGVSLYLHPSGVVIVDSGEERLVTDADTLDHMHTARARFFADPGPTTIASDDVPRESEDSSSSDATAGCGRHGETETAPERVPRR